MSCFVLEITWMDWEGPEQTPDVTITMVQNIFAQRIQGHSIFLVAFHVSKTTMRYLFVSENDIHI